MARNGLMRGALGRLQRAASARESNGEWPHGPLIAIGAADRPEQEHREYVLVGEASRARKITPFAQASVAYEPGEERQQNLRMVPNCHDLLLE